MLEVKNIILKKRTCCNIFNIDSNSDKILDFIASKLDSGANFIQLKQNTNTSDFFKISHKIRQLTSIYNSILIIQDRIDIAKLIEADGVFLDKNSIDINHAKMILDNNMIFGSDNSDEADYIISIKPHQNIITYIKNDNKAEYRAIYEEL